MTLWIFISLLSAIVLLAMIFAARGGKVAHGADAKTDGIRVDETENHFKLQLADIDANVAAGRLSEDDGQTARAELAREIVSHRAALSDRSSPSGVNLNRSLGWIVGLTGLVSIFLAIGAYLYLGSPDMLDTQPPQGQQLAGQNDSALSDFQTALARVEEQMVADPTDIRGWQVLGPAYMRLQRFEDAVGAYRKILELAPPTADAETDLAEALLMMTEGDANSEIMALLQSASERDATHVRSRFYLAAEATRAQKWDEAIAAWNELISLSNGQERWLETARNGLAAAMARGEPVEATRSENGADSSGLDTQPGDNTQPAGNASQSEFIRSMVEGLDQRLNTEGGTIEEWTRLVRSLVVLEETDRARLAYEKAAKAYPDENVRAELDMIAAEAGFLDSAN